MKTIIFFIFGILLFPITHASTPQCTIQVSAPFATPQVGQVTYLPSYGCVTTLQLAGHLPVNQTRCTDIQCSDHSESLFYWFVASKQSTHNTPIVLWLDGGPGASSFYGFFTGNGPYVIDNNGKLHNRISSWSETVHYLIIDNPKGVGFSYTHHNDFARKEEQVAIELYNALHAFYRRYPALRNNPIYLGGESYAGKYTVELADQIMNHNTHGKKSEQINLAGLLVGNGWVNPLVQQSSVAQYAYSHGLIDKVTYKSIKKRYERCANAIKQGKDDLTHANKICMDVNDSVVSVSGVDRHDIRMLSNTEDDSAVIRYLNKPEVRKALHVDSRVGDFKLFSDNVSQNLEPEIQKSAALLYEKLLNKGIPILIYSGLDDGTDSNFIGTDRWLSKLTWHGQDAFSHALTCQWRNEDTHDIAGYVRSAQGLTQIKMRGAGHKAAKNQAQNTLKMLQKFISHQRWC